MEKERFVNMDFFRSLKDAKLKFNPRPFSNPLSVSSEKFEVVEKNFVDLHAEIAKKVDELVISTNREPVFEEWDFTPEEKTSMNPERVVFTEVNNI